MDVPTALEDAIYYSLVVGAGYGLIRALLWSGRHVSRLTVIDPPRSSYRTVPTIDPTPRTRWTEVGWLSFGVLIVAMMVSQLSSVRQERQTLFLSSAIVLGAALAAGVRQGRIEARTREPLVRENMRAAGLPE